MASLPSTLTPTIAGYSNNETPRVGAANLGEGYRQRIVDGPNNILITITLEFIGSYADIQSYVTFFRDLGGATTFDYTLPMESTSRKWTAGSWSMQAESSDTATLTVDIREEFDL